MAPLTQKIHAEHRMRELLREADLPQPDTVEYDESCIRLRYDTQMVCLVIDLEVNSDGDPDAPVPAPPDRGR